MIVVASSPPDSPATAALSRRLRRALPALAAGTGSTAEIGQGAQYLLDYTNANTPDSRGWCSRLRSSPCSR